MLDLDNQESNLEAPADKVGGSSFIKDADIYDAEIKMCFYDEAASGAALLHFEFKLESDGYYSEDIYFSSNKKNGQKITYTKDGKTHLLPGAQTCASVIYAALEDSVRSDTTLKDVLIGALKAAESKEIEVYDRGAGKNVKKTKNVLTSVTGKSVKIGINSLVKPRGVKTDNGYADSSNETYECNELSLIFCSDNLTPSEKVTSPKDLYDGWITKRKGQVMTIKPKKNKAGQPIESKDGKPIGETESSADTGSSMFD